MSTTLPDSVDVLVVGGGAAGLYTALCLPSSLQVGLITKDTLALSASDWAQGGLAAAIAPDDSPQLHFQDTLSAGVGLCEPEAVALLVERAPECVRSLLEMGVTFDRQGDTLALTLEAAHSKRRVLHSADTTGRAIVTTLKSQVLDRPNIHVFSQAFVLDLWLNATGNRCLGVYLLHQDHLICLAAKTTVLATGGGGQAFAHTTNPALSTGDGVAMAWRAGALLRDLEFVQFHPTALYKPGAPRFLVSEAVRGEGAHLIDHTGQRFMFDYHPAGELAPRDVVSRAIFRHLQYIAPDPATAHVWLDLRSIPPATIQHRFPNIIAICRQWGVDILQNPIPVAPAAHYWMGGVVTDLTSQTSIAGLYAVGETASTGVHGANRLASNSLLECLVFGAQLRSIDWTIGSIETTDGINLGGLSDTARLQISDVERTVVEEQRSQIPRLMWQSAGICREQQSMEQAIAQVEEWRSVFANLTLTAQLTQPTVGITLNLGNQTATVRQWAETRNLLDIAYLILRSAEFRTESRGGHYRVDFPETLPVWQAHTLIQRYQWKKSPAIAS